jgi:hypothetical protein
VQWAIATFITSVSFDTYLYGFISGGSITLSALGVYRYYKGTQLMRVVAAIAMMLFSVVYIQQHYGRIEMHFHVFIAMAFLSLYKDIVPVFVASLTTVVHHFVFIFGFRVSLFGMPVWCSTMDAAWIVLLHAVFVIPSCW